MEITNNVNLSKCNFYRTGGQADFYCECRKALDFLEALEFAKGRKIPFVIIGGGSNILVSDKGFRGLVIVNKIKDLKSSGARVEVGSGYGMAKMLVFLLEGGLSGLEFMAGIPGTVGGAIYGNAGSFGQSISDYLVSVTVINEKRKIVKRDKKDLKFSYRKSSLSDSGDLVILAVFDFKKGNPREIKEKMNGYLKKKKLAQPPGFSCGSYFKNPKGDYAGRVIEELNFKGKEIGGAQVSKKHANFIVNTGHATSDDIYRLAQEIKKAAREKLGVKLEEEVKYIGEFN